MKQQQCLKILSAILVLGLLVSVATTANAVSPTVTVSGTVQTTDGDFAPEGLTVKLYSFAKGEVVSTTNTKVGGFFMFSTVPGYYKLIIDSQRKVNSVYLSAASEPFGVFTQNVEKEITVEKKDINAYVNGTITLGTGASFTTNATVRIVDLEHNYYEEMLSYGQFDNTTNTTNPRVQEFNISFYPGKYNLIVEYPEYAPSFNKTVILTENEGTTESVTLYKTYIKGLLRDADGNILTNVTHTTISLIDKGTQCVFTKEITDSPYFEIGAYPGDFVLVVCADGFTPYINTSVSMSDGILTIKDAKVKPLTKTQILSDFNLTSMNNLSAVTRVKMNPYTTLPWFKMGNTGLIRLQIDFVFGNKDFKLSQSELDAFKAYIEKAGPLYVPNQFGFEINNTAFTNVSGYTISVKDAGITNASVPVDVNTDAPIYINYTYKFTADAKINESDVYECTFGYAYDTIMQDYQYRITLPAGYVLTDNTFDRNVVDLAPVDNWQVFTIDPKTSGNAAVDTATMKFEKFSDVQPVINVTAEYWGDHNVLNDTYENYTVIVKTDENVTFSAQNSRIPVGNITKYIWDFGDGNTNETENITVNHTYSTPAENLKVKLTVVGSGGQTNSTTMTLHVDGVTPKPVININGNNTTYVWSNVTTALVFNGSFSTDAITKNDENGTILKWEWNFGDNTTVTETLDNRMYNISHTYLGGEVPYVNSTTLNISGKSIAVKACWIYNVTLNVTDVAGNWANTTVVVIVNDTEEPVPVIKIRDMDGTETTSVIEMTNITLNANESYDPHGGTIVKYNWTIEKNGVNYTQYETNNTTYTIAGGLEPGDWNITLTVYDYAGNAKNTTRVLNVRLNTTARPDLEIQNVTLPDKFEVGVTSKITVIIKNIGGENSSAVLKYLSFTLISGDGSTKEVGNITSFTYPNGTALKYNESITVEFQWTPDTAGTFTLNVSVYSDNEYYTYTDNNVMKKEITVNEAAWKTYAMYGGGIAAVIIALLVIYYISRRRKAGEEEETKSEKKSGKEEKKEEKKEKKK